MLTHVRPPCGTIVAAIAHLGAPEEFQTTATCLGRLDTVVKYLVSNIY